MNMFLKYLTFYLYLMCETNRNKNLNIIIKYLKNFRTRIYFYDRFFKSTKREKIVRIIHFNVVQFYETS